LILQARASDLIGENAPPGTIDRNMCVVTNDGSLEIIEIKPANGRAMKWIEFVNGRHIRPGDRFITPAI